MRKLHLADNLTIRFPARCQEFDEGFEVGVIAALMSARETEFTRTISSQSLDQAKTLASKLGYHVTHVGDEHETITATFRSRRARPKLRIVHSVRLTAAS